MKPSRKHQKFIDEYFKNNFNATLAYMKVYPKADYHSARVLSSKLLANVSIKAEIDTKMESLHLSSDEALKILAAHAKGELSDFINEYGEVDLDQARKKGVLGLLKEYETIETSSEKSSTSRKKIKLHDPHSAIDKIARLKGWYKDSLEIKGNKIIQVTIGKEDASTDSD